MQTNSMKTKIQEHKLPFNSHKLYEVYADDSLIETLVTHDSTMVSMWVKNNEIPNSQLIVVLDTEWRPIIVDNCIHTVSVLQLCVGESCLIFQVLHADKIPIELINFIENPNHTFVGVGIDNDVKKLFDEYGLKVANTRDLRIWAADKLDNKELCRAGLKTLTKLIIGRDIDKPKDITLSRWDNSALSQSQVIYACLDAAYLSFKIGRLLSFEY